jgi:SAM-dependent methyltransferase
MTRHPESSAALWFSNPGMAALLWELRRTLAGCHTVLDVGCGEASPLRYLPTLHLTGLDGYAPSLERARAQKTHDAFQAGDVRKVGELLAGKKFDAVVALDVIEHLTKEDGQRMLAGMERLATRRVVIFTPNGFVPQRSQNGDLQEHLSGWEPAEMRQAGYEVLGMHGPKRMRGEYARLRHRPRAVAGLVSLAAHFLLTRLHPEKAFSIYCIKRKQ